MDQKNLYEGTRQAAVLVAGGKGLRMGFSTPKQFLDLGGKPVICYSLEAFVKAIPNIFLVLVLPEDQIRYWKDRLLELESEGYIIPNHQIVSGGSSRQASVFEGLKACKADYSRDEECLVAIHDAARPLIEPSIIQSCFQHTLKNGSAVVSVPLKDSIRMRNSTNQFEAKNRNDFMLMQTPQVFYLEEIYKWHEFAFKKGMDLTDDASIYELSGKYPELIEGNYTNLKITTAEDYYIAEALIRQLSHL